MKIFRVLTLIILFQCCAAAQTTSVSVVNAANFRFNVAPDSIAAIFGDGFATTTEFSQSLPLPKTLAGVRVEAGIYPCDLFAVSPRQINFHVPAALGLGPHQVKVTTAAGTFFLGSIFVTERAPSIFTVDRNGQGRAEGYSIPAGQVTYLVLFGTGLRRGGSFDTWLNIAGVGAFRAVYVGPAPGFVGLDQINVAIPTGALITETGAFLQSGAFQSQGFAVRP